MQWLLRQLASVFVDFLYRVRNIVHIAFRTEQEILGEPNRFVAQPVAIGAIIHFPAPVKSLL